MFCFLCDAKEGLNPIDTEVGKIIRNSGKPSFLLVNKVDNNAIEAETYEFYRLGFETVYPISATHGRGIVDFLDDVAELIPESSEEEDTEEENIIKVAIVGRQNVGKSTMLNALVGKKRVITSNVGGTTRDPIDIDLEYDGQKYTFIDTAGIRRRGKVEVGIEKITVVAAQMSLERCDVILFLFDASEGVTQQDAHIAGLVFEANKPVIIVANKWDKLEAKDNSTWKKQKEDIEYNLQFLSFAPFITTSAKTGQRVKKIYQHINELYEAGHVLESGHLRLMIYLIRS